MGFLKLCPQGKENIVVREAAFVLGVSFGIAVLFALYCRFGFRRRKSFREP